MKEAIIRMLKECDGHISGQQLCDNFGVSRTAVWKVIKQLQKEGYEIEAVRNKGYHLVKSGDVMTEAEIKSCIKGTTIGRQVAYYEETDSTNTRAKYLAEQGAEEGTLVIAERQNAGKGRRGKNWTSPPGSGIWMSIVLRPDILPFQASMLTLVAAMGVFEGIYQETGLEPQIKWPNDLVLSGKKICGILTEMTTELDTIQYVVIGIGVNVNIESFPQELSQTATSLYLESGEKKKRSTLVGAIAKAFEQYYHKFLAVKNLSLLKQQYESHLANQNRQVTVMSPNGQYSGICLGINEQGELLVEKNDGQICQVLSGEVSVRGIYGYV